MTSRWRHAAFTLLYKYFADGQVMAYIKGVGAGCKGCTSPHFEKKLHKNNLWVVIIHETAVV
jgi:hypothetical protein